MNRALTLKETSALIGKSDTWLRENYPRLTGERGFPAPIPTGGPLHWDAAAVHSWLLTTAHDKAVRAGAAALRAAEASLSGRGTTASIDAAREELDRKFGVTS